jgi:hypothetical protein
MTRLRERHGALPEPAAAMDGPDPRREGAAIANYVLADSMQLLRDHP